MIPSLSTAQLARIAALLAPFTERQGPGLAIDIARGGQTLLQRGVGLASVELGVPIDEGTRFRIASVSKHFTVAAVLRLQAQGLLNLDDDARRFIPELAPLPAVVTIDQLMRNTSGLPDFLELLRLGGVGLEQRITRETMLAAIARNRHLNFAPGSRFLYCNSNFLLLGLIVERLSGQTLAEHLQAQFFGPLGMTDTAMELASDSVVQRLALPYLSAEKRAVHGFEHGGEGGLVSSVADLLCWARQWLEPSPELLALMAPTTLSGGQPSPYARGLEHSRWLGRDCIGHGGLWPGFKTEFLLMPSEQLSVVVIANDGGSNPYKLARELARIVLDEPAPTASGARLSGHWFDAESGQLIELFEQGGAQMARQFGITFELREDVDGAWLAWRGAYEFRLQPLDAQNLRIELDAGQVAVLRRLDQRAPLPADLRGAFRNEDTATTWRIDEAAQLWVSGPLLTPPQPWRLIGLDAEWVELQSQGYWMQPSQLLRLDRDAEGRLLGFRMDSARIKGLRFVACKET